MNAAEELRREGWVKGELAGELKGKLEGKRTALLRVLAAKFRPLPPETEARVTAADEATLDRWLDAAAVAQRLAEVMDA